MSLSINNGSTERDSGIPLSQGHSYVHGLGNDFHGDVSVSMVVQNRPMWHYVDDGETVELFVTFNEGIKGMPYNGSSHDNDDGEWDYEVLTRSCVHILYHVSIV